MPRRILGNKKKLTQWQDKYWEHMVKKYPDLERGESASETGRDHIPTRVFKQMARLNKQHDKLARTALRYEVHELQGAFGTDCGVS